MIKVDRKEVAIPSSLKRGSNPVSKGEKETEDAIAYYDQSKPGDLKSFTFTAYKEDDVKLALDKLFHGKCAYCESVYAGTQPMDVEHWRPKGEIARIESGKRIKVRKPGYYWLAAEWTNLLPSCIDCNRQRSQLELKYEDSSAVLDSTGDASNPDIPENTYEVFLSPQEREKLLDLENLGKKNLFPVKNDVYAKDPRKHPRDEGENPLILNPCEDEPGEYLEYVEEAVVRPISKIEGDSRQRAENSIFVYGLNRSRLVYERMERLLEIKARLYTLERLALIYQKLNLNKKNEKRIARMVEEVIEHETRNLRRYMLPEQPFAGMARQVIRGYFDSMK